MQFLAKSAAKQVGHFLLTCKLFFTTALLLSLSFGVTGCNSNSGQITPLTQSDAKTSQAYAAASSQVDSSLFTKPLSQQTNADLGQLEAAVHLRINRERAKEISPETRQPLPAFVRNPVLDQIARLHSVDLSERDVLSHRGRNGLMVDGRFDIANVRWQEVGENVARNRGYDDPALEAVRSWMKSPGHRVNIVSASYVYTGIGAAIDPNTGMVYITQVFLKAR